jgi:hypothetical protein
MNDFSFSEMGLGIMDLFSREWMERFKKTINEDRELSWIGKFFTCRFVWKIGQRAYLFRVANGKVLSIAPPTWNDSWDFALEGPEEAWRKFAMPLPPPLYHDLLGMVTRLPDCQLSGNRLLAMQHIRALTRLMSLVREVKSEGEQ